MNAFNSKINHNGKKSSAPATYVPTSATAYIRKEYTSFVSLIKFLAIE